MNAQPAHHTTPTTTTPANPAATSASRRQDRCQHGHFMAAGDTTCHKDDCGAPRRPQLSLVKPQRPQPTGTATKAATTAAALPRRTRSAAHTDGTRAYATHAAMMAGLPATVLGWGIRPDGTAYQYLPDGTLLSHPGTYGAAVTAVATCTRGAAHVHLVTSPRTLHAALDAVDHCRIPHAALAARALPLGLRPRTGAQ